ncbi:MAG: histidine--tRNA ligase [Bordetella sp.]|nr:MAG: histidine--tRNA ligase [Bordetella sp.]
MDRPSKIFSVRGMRDILPEQATHWQELEDIIQDWLHSYGYCNFRVPILERTQLFCRGIGNITDIVQKEMYSFTDFLSGDQLTIRPEITAGLIRASIEHNFLYKKPRRIYSIGPVFRHERPQSGRYRQFHQANVEALGFVGPDIDAELIIMLSRLWKKLGINDYLRLELNSLGELNERIAYRDSLIDYLKKNLNLLDEDSKRRLHSNPLRILDTKNLEMQDLVKNAPSLFDFFGKESCSYFDNLCKYLEDSSVNFKINTRLVRGLDYYNLTVFEWIKECSGNSITICGGGRYNGLTELLGGKSTPAVGFAIGIERLLDLWLKKKFFLNQKDKECDIYIVRYKDFESKRLALRIGEELRNAEFSVIVHAGSCEFTKQFRMADSSGAEIAILIGPNEIAEKIVLIKYLKKNLPQQKVLLNNLADFLRSKRNDIFFQNGE